MLAAALIGFAFGFFGSIPVAGPIAALVLKRGLTGRFRSAIFIGAGASVAEAAYAFLAMWGFSTYLAKYPIIEPVSRGVAAAILIGLGVSFARYQGAKETEERKIEGDSPARSALLGFTVTILNPTLIATWTGATATLYSTKLVDFEPASAPMFALGSLLGIAGWFGLLTFLLKRYRGRFDTHTLNRVVRVIGWLVLGLGLWFAWRFVSYLLGE